MALLKLIVFILVVAAFGLHIEEATDEQGEKLCNKEKHIANHLINLDYIEGNAIYDIFIEHQVMEVVNSSEVLHREKKKASQLINWGARTFSGLSESDLAGLVSQITNLFGGSTQDFHESINIQEFMADLKLLNYANTMINGQIKELKEAAVHAGMTLLEAEMLNLAYALITQIIINMLLLCLFLVQCYKLRRRE